MKNLTRRHFIKVSAASGGALLIPRWSKANPNKQMPMDDAHFFLQIYLQGGADLSYLFDARPLAMTNAGKMQNYLNQDPMPFVGKNGTSCYATSLTAPLMSFKDKFSVINGVVMTDFDGHPQNTNMLFTGNAFGGEAFLPHFNLAATGQTPTVIDTTLNGLVFVGSFTNGSGIVPLKPKAIGSLSARLAAIPGLDGGSELGQFIRARLQANSSGNGLFDNAVKQMSLGYGLADSLRSKLMSLSGGDPSQDDDTQFTQFLGGVFRSGISRSALWVFDDNYDTHSFDIASKQADTFARTLSRIVTVFKNLTAVPFDDKRSLFDVTTVMISTEFGRTMRQPYVPFDSTGTDHNQFTNSIILAGRGINSGLVIGESDFRTSDEVLSPAHLALDTEKIKVFGRPFDFQKMQPRTDLPAAFNMSDYLTSGSVINTLYSLFNVPKDKYRALDRAGTLAPLLTPLLETSV